MGSRAARGGGASPPSRVTYYVAMAGIVALLLLLCFYFFYYFIKRVKELSSQESPLQSPAPSRPPAAPPTAPYPVQPVVRESATAMAKLCKQLPTASPGKGDTVFPASTSPGAQHSDTVADRPTPLPDKTIGPPVPLAAGIMQLSAAR